MSDHRPVGDQPDRRPPPPLIGEPILPPLEPEGSSGYEPAVISAPGSATRASFPEASQSIMVFILGVAGLFVQMLAPVAWYLGKKEVDAIDAGRRPGNQRGLAQAGKILGIIGSLILISGVLFVLLAVVLIVTGG